MGGRNRIILHFFNDSSIPWFLHVVCPVFYPIFGVRIYGWIGDLIDFASAVTAFIGCATALGFADIFLLTGINHITPSLSYLSGDIGSKTQNTDGRYLRI